MNRLHGRDLRVRAAAERAAALADRPEFLQHRFLDPIGRLLARIVRLPR